MQHCSGPCWLMHMHGITLDVIHQVEWFLCLGELMALIEEATLRHATALNLQPLPTPMPISYIAQRLDTDEPLWGYQVPSPFMISLHVAPQNSAGSRYSTWHPSTGLGCDRRNRPLDWHATDGLACDRWHGM